jgi:protein TonB
MNKQLLARRYDSNDIAISLALAISLTMHFGIMHALPWLETVKAKPPITIIAELQTLAPPPPPPAESKPIEPPSKPEVVKLDHQPKPMPKPQTVAERVLTAEHTEVTNNYTVPDVPKAATLPSEPSAPAMPEASSAPSESAATPSKNAATSSSSTSTWDDSNVWDEYGRSLQRMVERNKKYPAIAIRRSLQGLAKVLVRFSSEGKALIVLIEKSTGHKVLDEQALEMVRKSLNDLPVPNKFKGREFKLTIPVDFKLE